MRSQRSLQQNAGSPIVDVGREYAFAQIVEHDRARDASQSPERFFVQLGPHARTGSEHQQADAFPAVAQRQNEQARAPIASAVRIAHHGTGAVIDLGHRA